MKRALGPLAVWLLVASAGCSPGQSFSDASAADQIAGAFSQYPCAKYFTIGTPTIKDKLVNAPAAGLGGTGGQTNDIVVDAVTPLSKTDAYVVSIEHATLLNLATTNCSDDFFAPLGRFNNLAGAFQKVPVGTPINFEEHYRFQKWDTGWRLVGQE